MAPLPAFAAESGFAFLRVPVSARSVGMGESGVALLEGADAFFLNPAGLAAPAGDATSTAQWKTAGEAAVTHHEAFSNFHQDAGVLNVARGPEALALQFQTFYSGDVPQTDEVGNPLGNFGLVDLALQLGYARLVSPGLRFGGTVGYVKERVANSSAGTWAFSAGGDWSPSAVKGLRVGASVRQLGGSTHFEIDGAQGTPVSLPTTVQGGLAYTSKLGTSGHWALAADVRKASDESTTEHAGAEAGWSMVAVRVGGRFGTDVGHFTAGLGVNSGRFTLDYAFLPSNESLGDSHRLELRIRFGL
jgi:hypothetical protein